MATAAGRRAEYPAAVLAAAELEARRRGLAVARGGTATPGAPWITFDGPPGDRFAFTFDLGAASPLKIDAADEDEYRREIVAWSHLHDHRRQRGAERPALYHYTSPALYDRQRAAIFAEARSIYVEASTKAGKTAAGMVRLLEAALKGKPGQNYWWVSPVYAQARMVMRRYERAVPRSVYISNLSEMILELPNGALIVHKSGDKPDTLYGEDVAGVVIDEASRVKQDSMHAIESTLTATGGWKLAIGNVRGRRNWFYEAAQRAKGGEPRTHYARLTWRDAVGAGIVAAETIEDAQRSLPPAVFRELYEAEAAENAANPFGTEEQILACAAPMSDGKPVAWGWDLAKRQDWTVGIALDAEGRACRFLRFQRDWGATKATILRETAGAAALVDSTGVGDPIVEDLTRANSRIQGYHFSAPSKQRIMEGLASWIQERKGTYPDVEVMRDELMQFEYSYSASGVRYSAPEGFHDDCVCGLALAVECGRSKHTGGAGKLPWYTR